MVTFIVVGIRLETLIKPPMFDLHPMRALFLMSQKAFKPPKLKEKKWSKEFNDFIKVSLTKSPRSRPTGDKLLMHAFVIQPGKRPLDCLKTPSNGSIQVLVRCFARS